MIGSRASAFAGCLALTLAAVAPIALAAQKPEKASDPAAEAKALRALGQEYYDKQAAFDPLAATASGDTSFNDKLAIDIAPAERKRREAAWRDLAARLQKVDRKALPRGAQVSYDVLAHQLDLKQTREKFPSHLLPLQQMDSVPVTLATYAGGEAEQPLKTAQDYDAFLKRIARLPEWNEQAIANLREGMKRGIVQPKAIITSMLPALRKLATKGEANPFMAPVQRFPEGFRAAERQRLTRAYGELVEGKLQPSLAKLADFVEREYLPAGRDTVGIGALPGGAEWYAALIRENTTVWLDAEQIHALGLAEVARIEAAMAGLRPKLAYQGDPGAFMGWLRNDNRFRPYKGEAAILDAYRKLNERVTTQLPRLFGRLPRAPLEVRPEPELTRATASDHYTPPADDGSRPGVYWAVITDPLQYATPGMTSLFLHEGQPGHHLQMALQQEMGLPRFRRNLWLNAYGEGWALYAETLGHELGLYKDDPAAHAGQLRGDLARSVRLVVDTGLHAKGWTREQAMAYWQEKLGSGDAAARSQIERYIAWPGQALGYKIGALRIQELRDRAQAALGPRFSLAAFHDAVLADGSVPLDLLEANLMRWVEDQRR